MYEELVKRIRGCSYSDPNGCEECRDCPNTENYYECKQKLALQAADAIEELSRVAEAIPHVCECCIGCEVETGGCDRAFVLSPKRAREYLSKPRWIPATKAPKEDGWYQVYAPGYSGGSSSGLKNIRGNMYSAFKNGKWSIEVGYHKRPGCVKAWMPLPEPPKDGWQ